MTKPKLGLEQQGGVLDTDCRLIQEVAADAPLGVAASKELVRLTVVDADRADDRLAAWQPPVFEGADGIGGVTGFVERRVPAWRGR